VSLAGGALNSTSKGLSVGLLNMLVRPERQHAPLNKMLCRSHVQGADCLVYRAGLGCVAVLSKESKVGVTVTCIQARTRRRTYTHIGIRTHRYTETHLWMGELVAGDEGQKGDGLPSPGRHLRGGTRQRCVR
jgi:hypothetical protein